MPQNRSSSRVELMIAGLGGMGAVVAGRVLASAGLREYKYASFVPSYGSERRGGLSECTVVLSDGVIASPILNRVQSVILLDSSQIRSFENRVHSGGLIIAEQASLKEEPHRGDITLLAVSGLEIALGVGGMIFNNLVLLGVYTEVVKPVPHQLVEEELKIRYRDDLLRSNLEAFRKGLELGKSAHG